MDLIYESPQLKVFYVVNLLPVHYQKKYKYRSIHKIDRIIIHHTAGSTRNRSIMAPMATAKSHVNDRNWPGIGYHYYIPYRDPFVNPEMGPVIVYQTQDLETWSYHTGPNWNQKGLGIVCQGSFYSRHERISTLQPSNYQMKGIDELWIYLKKLLGLTNKSLFGHYHAGKRTCPGDQIEMWIEEKRREGGNNIA